MSEAISSEIITVKSHETRQLVNRVSEHNVQEATGYILECRGKIRATRSTIEKIARMALNLAQQDIDALNMQNTSILRENKKLKAEIAELTRFKPVLGGLFYVRDKKSNAPQ